MRILLFLFFFLPQFVFSQDKVKFTATGVTCSLCSNAIHNSLKGDKSIIKIEPDLQTQEWHLEYKSNEFKTENLIRRIEDAGFFVGKLYLNGQLILDNTKKKKEKNHKQ